MEISLQISLTRDALRALMQKRVACGSMKATMGNFNHLFWHKTTCVNVMLLRLYSSLLSFKASTKPKIGESTRT